MMGTVDDLAYHPSTVEVLGTAKRRPSDDNAAAAYTVYVIKCRTPAGREWGVSRWPLPGLSTSAPGCVPSRPLNPRPANKSPIAPQTPAFRCPLALRLCTLPPTPALPPLLAVLPLQVPRSPHRLASLPSLRMPPTSRTHTHSPTPSHTHPPVARRRYSEFEALRKQIVKEYTLGNSNPAAKLALEQLVFPKKETWLQVIAGGIRYSCMLQHAARTMFPARALCCTLVLWVTTARVCCRAGMRPSARAGWPSGGRGWRPT